MTYLAGLQRTTHNAYHIWSYNDEDKHTQN